MTAAGCFKYINKHKYSFIILRIMLFIGITALGLTYLASCTNKNSADVVQKKQITESQHPKNTGENNSSNNDAAKIDPDPEDKAAKTAKVETIDYEAEAKNDVESLNKIMGDWEGIIYRKEQQIEEPVVAQIIAFDNGRYQANLLSEFNKRVEPIVVLIGYTQDDGSVKFSKTNVTATIENGLFNGIFISQEDTFNLSRIYRVSPTMGKKPPAGAKVLFDGKSLENWKSTKDGNIQWKVVDKAIEVLPRTGSIYSKEQFGDCMVHLEFRTPLMPSSRGQDRGNSGVYLQGRYEVQILDSYGLKGHSDECGAIYQRWDPNRRPKGYEGHSPWINAALPPGQWQTYDIYFKAPKFDENGKKIEDAIMVKVLQNGQIIHKNQKLSGPTRASMFQDEKPTGPLYLQGHGSKVQYRNIWVAKFNS